MLGRSRMPDATSRPRILGAAWMSAGLHLLIAAAAAVVFRIDQPPDGAAPAAAAQLPPVVWIEARRPGGDDGGLGDRARQAAPPAERPGADRRTIPTRAAAAFERPGPSEPRVQEVNIPAVPEASGLREVPGTLSAVAAVDLPPGGPGAGPGLGDGAGPGVNRGGRNGIGDGPGGPGGDVQPPLLVSQVRPDYTAAALAARVQGMVGMEAVVMPDGSVGEVRVVRSLDPNFGLDQQAIKAVKLWRFRPARRQGKAVPMFVRIELTFSLR
jgi:TonB family protein